MVGLFVCNPEHVVPEAQYLADQLNDLIDNLKSKFDFEKVKSFLTENSSPFDSKTITVGRFFDVNDDQLPDNRVLKPVEFWEKVRYLLQTAPVDLVDAIVDHFGRYSLHNFRVMFEEFTRRYGVEINPMANDVKIPFYHKLLKEVFSW